MTIKTMQKTIYLSSAILTNLMRENAIVINRKSQKTKDNYNYYVTPNVGLKLYNARVLACTSRFIVLRFERRDSINLLILLKYVSESLIYLVKQQYPDEYKTTYDIHVDQEDYFTVRCYIPCTNGKYHINQHVDGQDVRFTIPRVNTTIKELDVDIRNLWKDNGKLGFNVEVKEITI